MPLVWNYLEKCPCFETRFLDNRVVANLDLGGKKNSGTRVPFKELEFMELKFHKNIFKELEFHNFFFFFKFSVRYNLIVQKLSFKLKLNF